MLAEVLVLLVLSQDGISFHMPKSETHILRKLSADASVSKNRGGTKAEYGEFPFILVCFSLGRVLMDSVKSDPYPPCTVYCVAGVPGLWMLASVSLEVAGHHHCGGSVISDNWLVTAGHCIDDPNYSDDLVIRAGSMTKEEGGTVHEIEEIIRHPDYNNNPVFDSDIALIKVKTPFSTNEYVRSVHLGKEKDIPEDGTDVVSAGWGVTMRMGFGATSKELLKVTLQAVDSKKCDTMPGMDQIRIFLPDSNFKINDNMICAIIQDKDTMKGESGGPLLKYVSGNTEPLLVGIVSWGEYKEEVDNPIVYANVANFIKWIYLATATLPK